MATRFSSRMTQIGELLVRNAQEIVRSAALACAEEAIMRTPVKTGNARVNWKVSSGSPKMGLSEAPGTDNIEVNAQTAAAEALINASNVIATWKMGKGSIFVGNAVDYITDLDEGSSIQAMEGMSKFAIAAAREILQKGKLLRE